MNSVAYSVSLRIKKARLARRLHPIVPLLLPVSVILTVASAYLLWQGNSIGYGLLAVALKGLIIRWWYNWDLAVLPTSLAVANNTVLQIDQVIASDLASALAWPVTARELWDTVSGSSAGQFMIQRLELDNTAAAGSLDAINGDLSQIWIAAYQLQLNLGLPALDAACLVAALLNESPELLAAASGSKIQPPDVLNTLLWHARLFQAVEAKKHQHNLGGIGRDWAAGYTPTLNRYAHNITADVQSSQASYFSLARSQVLDQIMTNLSKAEQHNVILVGPGGTGKTSIIYALAERLLYISQQKSTTALQIMGLNPALITSASQVPGEIEQLMLTLFSDALHAGNMMIFMDEAQLFLQKGVGALDLSQLLLTITQQTSLRLIMALTPADYQRLLSSNTALAGLFTVVNMPELAQADVQALLEDRAVSLEASTHNVPTYGALVESYRLAERHITSEAFPGKAIKLLEDSFNYPVNGFVTAASVERCIEQTMGIKAAPAGEEEKAQLLNLEELLHEHMIDQVQAVSAVAGALRRNRAGVGSPKRPAGSFLFLGPTGVGKTELAKSLAQVYFGGAQNIIRLDMTEFQQAADVARILAPTAGGTTSLLMQIRQQPFSVVLLDELEKAHPDILNLFLQLLDEGHITDANGQPANFTNSIIIATSNAGADDIRAHIEAGEQLEQFQKTIIDSLIAGHQFRPELINRFDEVVIFKPLTKLELRQVVALLMAEVNGTLANQNINVTLTEAAVDYLAENGYDPQLGARPLRRLIQQTVQNRVADGILKGDVKPGASVLLDAVDLAPTSATQNPAA